MIEFKSIKNLEFIGHNMIYKSAYTLQLDIYLHKINNQKLIDLQMSLHRNFEQLLAFSDS